MKKLLAYLTEMDARAVRALVISVLLLVVTGVILVVGRLFFGDAVAIAVKDWLGGAERAHWGLPAAILAFTIAAFVAAPQFVLIAACVVAFGPERGFWYAWISTIVSGIVTFLLGRIAGADALKRFGGDVGERLARFAGKNGFMASALIRVVPSAPFIVVNMGMGATRMGILPFTAGLALGSLPKTAIVAFGGDALMDALQGKLGGALIAALCALALWLAVGFVARRVVRKGEDAPD